MFVSSKNEKIKPKENSSYPRELYDREVSTYEELTVKVLEILEYEGVDIYSEDNYGGMYLRQNSSNVSKIFNGSNQPKIIEEKEPETIDIPSSDLINFFK